MTYRTTESHEAILFKTLGYGYLGCKPLHRPNGKIAVEFAFVIEMDKVRELLMRYYNHDIAVDAAEHDEAWKFFRKEIAKQIALEKREQN